MLTHASSIVHPIETAQSDREAAMAAREMPRLLIVDRHPASILEQLREGVAALDFQVQAANTGADAIESIRNDPPNVVLLDTHLPDQCGLDIHRQILQIAPGIPVILTTTARTADVAIGAMKQGAYDVLFKPFESRQVQRVVGDALKIGMPPRAAAVVASAAPESVTDGAMLGICPGMREVYKAIGTVAGQDVAVLITGETGTGKELVARAIAQHS
jgi:two-component system response regulator AtoC